jgi:uncharacterized phosphatase
MTKIYLARHGQDKDNEMGILNGHRDMPLTELGVSQANQLSQEIKKSGLGFDKVLCSPLQRAYQTAKRITDALGIDAPEKIDLLIERDFGIMSGKRIKDIETLCAPDIIKAEVIAYFLSPEGAETFPQLITRAKKVLKFVTDSYRDQNILLVTHGDFGKMLYAAYYDLDWQQALTMFHFGNSELLLLAKDSDPEDSHVFNIKQYNH